MNHKQRTEEEKLRNRIDAHLGFHKCEGDETGDLRARQKMCGYLRTPYTNKEKTEVRGICSHTGQGCHIYDTNMQGKYECFVFNQFLEKRLKELKL